jgi:hypothetical protein
MTHRSSPEVSERAKLHFLHTLSEFDLLYLFGPTGFYVPRIIQYNLHEINECYSACCSVVVKALRY